VWVVPPTPIEVLNGPEMNEPARYEAQHSAIADVIATFGSAQVQAADVDAWLTLTEHAADRAWRPDGVHLSEDAARFTAELYLGPTLVDVALSG
jgi:hypothetical protein